MASELSNGVPEILVLFARLHHPDIAALVALHANVVRQPACQARRVHDAGVRAGRWRMASLPLADVQLARAGAILAAPLVEHYFGMTLSKCYRSSAGQLRCITCHSPHSQLSGREAVDNYRSKCLGCHHPENCKLPVEQRRQKSPADDCASCHMPKRTVTTITHAALTDHAIAARAGEPYPEEAFGSRALGESGLLHLTGQPGESPSSLPAITLLQAYAGLIREGHKELTAKRDAILERLSRNAPEDPVVLVALAKKAASKDTPESRAAAVRYFTRALRHGATAPEDFLLLAELYGRDNRPADAIQVLESGRKTNPYFREFHEQIAREQMALGQYGDALGVIRKGLELFPDDMALRLLEKKVRAATLDDSAPQ